MLEIIKGYIGCTIFLVTVYIFGRSIFESNKSNKKVYNLITFITCSIMYFLIVYLLDGTLKTIIACITFMIMFKLMFDVNFGRCLFAALIYPIITMFPDLLILTVATKILNVSKEYYYINFAGSILGNILVAILMILLIYIIRKPLRKIINHHMSTNKKIILIAFLTLTSVLIFFFHLINTFRLSNDIIGYLIVIITLVIILYSLFKQKIENENILKKYDDLLNIMKTYEEDIEEQRTMIHETRNELMTIKSKISDKEKESKIIKYIDSIIGDKVSSNMSKYSKFTYLPSNGIKGFFYYKFMEAEKKGINVSVNISNKIEKSFLSKLETKDFKDLVRIVGVYLDNAIEASLESKDKKLGIEIYMLKDDIDIILSNTYENELDKNKIGIEKFTTKGKNRGHGLLLVKHILNNNSIFKSNKEIVNNVYVQKLTVKNIK